MKSMTGYGRSQELIEGWDITVEIKSVNHRFFEFSSRLPRVYSYLEEKLKSFVQANVSRGKIDVGVTIYATDAKDTQVEINKTLVTEYVNALRNVQAENNLDDDLSLNSIMKLPDIFTVKKVAVDEEEIWKHVQSVAKVSVEKFIQMRVLEGQQLKKDISVKLNDILKNVYLIEEKNPQTTTAYKERLTAKMMEVLSDTKIDEQRILMEAAIYSERITVDEEVVRLKSHINQFMNLIEEEGPIGRKLDFLVQELNRETNTIGSKCQNFDITTIVVDIKSDIEKIREQIQNIE